MSGSGGEGQRERERESQADSSLSAESMVGLDPRSLGSHSGPKAGA